MIAKSVATLDVLSRGRVDLGIGTGWQNEEFTDPGLPLIGRTARMDDAARVPGPCGSRRRRCRSIPRRSRSPSFGVEPRPVQRRIPIWYGGAPTDAIVARIAELGDGWLPLGI